MQQWENSVFSNRQLGMTVYFRIVIIIVRIVNFVMS
jgi:hypothetical protein